MIKNLQFVEPCVLHVPQVGYLVRFRAEGQKSALFSTPIEAKAFLGRLKRQLVLQRRAARKEARERAKAKAEAKAKAIAKAKAKVEAERAKA